MTPFNLDANASVPPVQVSKDALLLALESQGNASSPHFLGRGQRVGLDSARSKVAAALGARDKEVVFNSGASEGNRWWVDAVVKAGRMRQKPLRVVATPLEHPSLAKPLREAHLDGLIELALLEIDSEANLTLDPTLLAQADVVFATAAHNETGRVPDLKALCAQVGERTIVISDAAQALGRLGPLPDRVDGAVASAHKMGGVAGAGALMVRGNARSLPAPWAGGGQESGLRPGSESLPIIGAFGAACEQITEIRAEHQALAAKRDALESRLLKAWPFARALAASGERLPNTSALTLSGVDGEALRIAIDTTGVCVGFGSACSSLAPEPSPALLAMGLSSAEARATIRFSLYPGLSDSDLEEALSRIIPAVLGLAQP